MKILQWTGSVYIVLSMVSRRIPLEKAESPRTKLRKEFHEHVKEWVQFEAGKRSFSGSTTIPQGLQDFINSASGGGFGDEVDAIKQMMDMQKQLMNDVLNGNRIDPVGSAMKYLPMGTGSAPVSIISLLLSKQYNMEFLSNMSINNFT